MSLCMLKADTMKRLDQYKPRVLSFIKVTNTIKPDQ